MDQTDAVFFKLYLHHNCSFDAICLSTRVCVPQRQGSSLITETTTKKGSGGRGPHISKEASQGHKFWQNAYLCSSQERGWQPIYLAWEQFIFLCCFLTDAVSLNQHFVQSKGLRELCCKQTALYRMESCPSPVAKMENDEKHALVLYMKFGGFPRNRHP